MDFFYHELNRDILVLRADGGLNASTAEQFVRDLEHIIDAGITKIIVDCEKLDYVSSYGLGVLLRLHRKLSGGGGDVKLACIGSKVVRILALSHIERMFDIYPDVSRAMLAFRPRDGASPSEATEPV